MTDSQKEETTDFSQQLEKTTDPLERFRLKLLSRGVKGVRHLFVLFRRLDADFSKGLDYKEFIITLNEYSVNLTDKETKALFDKLDKDGSGSIDCKEFIHALMPRMSDSRKELIEKAYNKVDKTGQGFITFDDLEDLSKYHELRTFFHEIDFNDKKDGKITKAEFFKYYSGVSGTTESDDYFKMILTKAYNM